MAEKWATRPTLDTPLPRHGPGVATDDVDEVLPSHKMVGAAIGFTDGGQKPQFLNWVGGRSLKTATRKHPQM